MAIRKILTEPNKILREKSLRVENVDKDIQRLMDDMLETLCCPWHWSCCHSSWSSQTSNCNGYK